MDRFGRGFKSLLRFTAPHVGGLIDTLPDDIGSMVTNSAGELFVATSGGIYCYENGAPSRRSLVANLPAAPSVTSLSPSVDERTLYHASGFLHAIDIASGASTFLGSPQAQVTIGYGMATFVPEPSMAANVVLAMALSQRTRRIH